MLRYIIPSVGSELKLQRRCPHCKRNNGNIHSSIRYRCISDTKLTAIAQRRMKCPWCKTTWTIRADGVGHARRRSNRLISLGIFLYMLGLSYRDVEKVVRFLGCAGSKSTIERDVAAAGQKAKALHLQGPRMRVRVLGVDGTGAKMAGQKGGLLFFVDIDSGKLISVEPVNEKEAKRVRQHVRRVFAEVGAEQLRTDELSVYEGIVPEENHKICLAHWLKSKCSRAWQLYRQLKAEGMDFEASDMLRLLQQLKLEPRPPNLPEAIEKLVRRYINCRRGLLWKVNQLLQHIERTWKKVSSEEADRTNNTTERIIGLDYKIRAKTMRGFKSWDKLLAHPYLSEYLRAADGLCDLRKVV